MVCPKSKNGTHDKALHTLHLPITQNTKNWAHDVDPAHATSPQEGNHYPALRHLSPLTKNWKESNPWPSTTPPPLPTEKDPGKPTTKHYITPTHWPITHCRTEPTTQHHQPYMYLTSQIPKLKEQESNQQQITTHPTLTINSKDQEFKLCGETIWITITTPVTLTLRWIRMPNKIFIKFINFSTKT
jgi:hypothetical protein